MRSARLENACLLEATISERETSNESESIGAKLCAKIMRCNLVFNSGSLEKKYYLSKRFRVERIYRELKPIVLIEK